MQTALLFACGLLLVGFVLRATIKPIQALYVPAAVIGGILGLVIVSLFMSQLFTIQADIAGDLDRQALTDVLRHEFIGAGIELSGKADLRVKDLGNRWSVEDQNRAFVIVKEKKRLNVYGVSRWWNTKDTVDMLGSWPGWLIAVIFSALLIERPGKTLGNSLKLAARAGIVVWIIILGEIMLGLAATWLIIRHHFDVPASFGQLIEAGFAGGHGTAAALGEVMSLPPINFPHGRDLGFVFATVGLIFGVASGIVYVNIAVRRGWTHSREVKIDLLNGLEARHDPQPIARGRVRSEVIDPLVFQVLILAVAFVLGMLLKFIFMHVLPLVLQLLDIDAATRDEFVKYAENLPLFMFTLMAGLLVREAMHLLKIGDLIDPDSMRRITGASMEFLIVAAIASLKLSAVVEFGWPIALLLLLGFIWTGFCLFFIARRLLPKTYWFELGILNYGMSTGTTAQGLMLLRIIDKDLQSGAAEDYALAAPLSAPFIGGGVITLTLPLLLMKVGAGWVVLALIVTMFLLYAIGVTLSDRTAEGST